MINDLNFLHFLTTSCIIEVFILILFKFTKQTSPAIINWYGNLGWTAIILDILSLMIGFYLSKFIYQIVHDFLFYFFVINPSPKNMNRVIDEFKEYAKHYGTKAVKADSLMYIASTPILYYIIKEQKTSTNTFISIVSFYVLGYLLHQKPRFN